jgi:hypothetical protein
VCRAAASVTVAAAPTAATAAASFVRSIMVRRAPDENS